MTDGSHGHAGDLGDRGERHARVVMQDDDGAVFRRQATERPRERIAIVDRNGLVRAARPVDRERSDVRAPPPVPAELLVTGINDEPMEPDLETVRIAQSGQLTPCEEECLLDGVLGKIGRAHV